MTALVEVRTGPNELEAEQFKNYLDVARRHGLQALLTISNQTPVADDLHPTKIDKRKLKRVDLQTIRPARSPSLLVRTMLLTRLTPGGTGALP